MKRLILFAVLALLPRFAAAESLCPLRLETDGKKLTLFVPDSLLGRKVLLNTKITSSSCRYAPIMKELSANCVFRISKADSSIVLSSEADYSNVVDADASIERALGTSRSGAVRFKLPVKKSADGVSEVDAAKLFDLSNKSVFDLGGHDYAAYTVKSVAYSSPKSKLLGVKNGVNGVGARFDASFDLTLQTKIFVGEVEDKEPFTADVFVALNLLEESSMPHKKADPRVGTRNVAYSTIQSGKGTDDEKMMMRWDLSEGRTIDIYLDTLMTPAQRQAAAGGFEAWNDAFEKIGMGRPVSVSDYPRSEDFDAADPFRSIVTFSGEGSTTSAEIVSDGLDRIIAARFFIPSNFALSVRRRAVYSISDVDSRYRAYNLSEDAVCEVLKADIMKLAGLCLGLVSNYAASYAYTPEQITDPLFTKEHGFTASVTDDVLFNYFAKPGDKEKGLATIVDRVGEYDEYALRWIYADGAVDSAPEHQYIARNLSRPDFRALPYDLSNDPLSAFEASIPHLKFVADNAADWLRGEDIDSDYRTLFLDWLWLRGNNMVFILSSQAGGFGYNAPREGSDLPKYINVPKDVQKRCMRRIFDFFRDIRWMDSKELLWMAGANKDVTDFTRKNLFQMLNAPIRFQFVQYCERNTGSDYSVQEYLDDLEALVFETLRAGSLPYGEMFIIAQYTSLLSSNLSGEPICLAYLDRAEKILKSCRAKLPEASRGEIDFLINRLDDNL